MLTREVISAIRSPADEVDYVAGLIHDVGKIALAAACPEHFDLVFNAQIDGPRDLQARERQIVGMDHAELGALYLKSHNLPDALVDVARYHHQPERAAHHASLIAAVQIADLLVRHAGIGNSGNRTPVSEEDWMHASGWGILFPQSDDDGHNKETERALAHANLKRSLERLPTILEGLV
jgi:HD-like signal output (HDOD) protein